MGWLVSGLLLILLAAHSLGVEPIKPHPDNGRYFLYNDRPVVLMGSSEHYGAIINLDFDYIRYLEETRACGLNYVRIFTGAYRETTGSFNIPDNTLAPLPDRSVTPWKRTTIPGAGDGGKKFDLTQWDPAYFHRLRDFVSAASKRGIVVELTLFSSVYDDVLWNLSPLNAANHINDVGSTGRANCYSPTGDLLPFQINLTRKCVTELQDFDNVIYETINEPYQQNVPRAWETLIIDEIVASEAEFPKRHLIAQNAFNYQGTISSPHPAVSLFHFHYAYPAAASQNYALGVALGDDETGNAGREDFPYRREAWEFMFSGGGLFNHLDYSFTATREDGIDSQNAPGGGGPAIRRQLGVLRWFLEELPLVNLVPQSSFVIGGIPSGGAATVIGAPGAAYAVYLRGGTQANLALNLPNGIWRGQWIDTRSGLVIGTEPEFSHPGGQRILVSPAYTDDIALRLFGGNLLPPDVIITSPSYNRLIPTTAASLTLTAEASVANGTLDGVEFFDGEQSLGTVTTAPYQLDLADLKSGQHIFRAKAKATDGRNASSPLIRATVIGPFLAGVNLNGNSLNADGVTLQSQLEALSSGLTITNTQPGSTSGSLTLYPPPDASTGILLSNHLLRLSATGNTELGITYPVPNGYYDVFLFIVEDQTSYSRSMRLLIEGQLLARGIGDQARGEWHKYGPYRTKVEDGTLNLGLQQDTKGVPKIAAFSIYQAAAPPTSSDIRLGIEQSGGLSVLSYPAGLTSPKIETSDDLVSAWQEILEPVSNFSAQDVIHVPMDRTKRFFRLKTE